MADGAKVQTDESTAEDEDRRVDFQHAFFKTAKSGYFRLPDDGENAVYVVDLDESEALLPVSGIKREFDLADDDPDAEMLDLIQEALAYVGILRLGDSLPKEVLTGEASWEISEEHREIAYSRLTLQMATWLTGDEVDLDDPTQLVQIADDPTTKEKVNQAFREAAEQLGFGDDDESKEKVVQLIEKLAEELAHIEALRDKFGLVRNMAGKIAELRGLYGNELTILEICNPVAQLIGIAVTEYGTIFEQVDAQTGEIMAVLKNIDSQIDFIRGMRDNIYRRLFVWEEMFDRWGKAMIKRSTQNEDLLRETYTFLAPRFMKTDEWVLMSQLQDNKEKNSTEMKW